MADFYEHVSEDTATILKRMQVYVDLALQQGDVIHSERAGELIIKIRLPKKEK